MTEAETKLVELEKNGASKREIDQAAQAVLNERGDAHTEKNILPPNHGIKTVLANRRLALSMQDSPELIEKAEAELADAQSEDLAFKLDHAENSHARTLSSLKESK